MNKSKFSTSTLLSFTLLLQTLFIPMVFFSSSLFATEILKSNVDFISEHFPEKPVQASMLMLDANIKAQINAILGHPYPALRIRYWQRNNKTLWILEEIGKVKPITTGIVIENHKIIDLQILAYRESRGYEVKYPFFREQFMAAEIAPDKQLSAKIDNITGATLSVNAVKKLARLALLLHSKVAPEQTH